jgi:beta-galactosidase
MSSQSIKNVVCPYCLPPDCVMLDRQALTLLRGMSKMVRLRLVVGMAALALGFSLLAQAQAPQPIVIDATAATAAPGPANYTFDPADAKSPDGHVLGLNSEYLTRDGKPWLPVMGEMHYSRVPEAEWEEQILKMKSAGVEIVAAYIIWIHHEEVEGEWDWQGQKDLRKFVQLCQKHGMYVVPRIGPWSHAEVRNGGFPDWLLTKTKQSRSNDPEYLKYVDEYFKQIGAQLKGLMWSEGGPVVAIQLENEYRGRPPLGGAPHILKLKEMARDAGIRVPFYTVTGWDGAAIPKGAVLPVYGGYPDAPWDASIEKLPANEVYAFRFASRVMGDMGAQNGAAPTGNAANFTRDTPFMTAEMGGGMQITYHRRPVVSPDDIAAMAPVMLGSGVNLYGSYMFQGGENPDGKLTTLQESLATRAPNDLPVKTYDFEAFLGEFGDERPSLLKEKSWNYFMNDWGAELAPMQPRRPEVTPAGAKDLSVVRVSARTLGASGFLFVNNHVRGYVMPARKGFQVAVKLPGGGMLMVPEKPVDVPADAYFVWPFNEDLDGLNLRFATAQPLARLGTAKEPVYCFFAQPGIDVEFVVEDAAGLKVDRTAGVERHGGAVWVQGLKPGPEERVRFTLANGSSVTLLVLRQEDAEQSWKIASGGATELLMTPQQAFVDGDVATLENLGAAKFSARVLPGESARLAAVDSRVKLGRSGSETTATVATSGPPSVALGVKQTKQPGEVAPLPAGFVPSSRPRVVAAGPTAVEWSRAGAWNLTLPKITPAAGEKRFLLIKYVGDVMRISVGGKLLDDNFADGRPWLVGLTRFMPELQKGDMDLSIYPLRKDAPIFFEPGLEPKVDGAQAVKLESVELVTQYSVKLKLETPTKH